MDLLGAVAIALLLKLGRDSIIHGTMTMGDFMTFIVATMSMYQPVRKFAGFYNNFQQAMGSSESVFHFMDLKDEVHERPDALKLTAFRESIRFENVRFSYGEPAGPPTPSDPHLPKEGRYGASSTLSSAPEAERDVLNGIDLEAKAGEVLAIVGGSGAGKSTMVHLIPRFFDVTGGRILVDGIDVRDLSLASLRGLIGIVTQETILFNDSVRNNIAYGQPHVSQQEVERAARAALAHDFIERMPEGYNTVIGERGFRLSGGERQRLSIARALMKRPGERFPDAHSVRRADRIVVLENGRIADQGSHEDLLSRLGIYRRLYELQFIDIDASKDATHEAHMEGSGV